MGDTMKVAVFRGVGDIGLEEHPRPVAYGTKALVKVDCCAICTWEQRVYTGVNKVDFPFIGGHETSGTIVALGEAVDSRVWAVGDKVVVGGVQQCGECYECRMGHENACSNFNHSVKIEGMPYGGMGGLSEYMLADTRDLFKYRSVAPQEAALTEPLSCVIHSVETADVQLADYVLVIGCGIMGLLHVQVAKRRGAVVIAADIDPARLALARELGADRTIDPSSESMPERVAEYTCGRKAQAVFDTTPLPSVLLDAYKCVANTGCVVLYSSIHPRPGEDRLVPVDPGWMHTWSIRTLGTMNSTPRDFMKAATLISEGVVTMKPFVSHMYPAHRVKDAFEKAVEGGSFRVVVSFSEE